VLNAANEAAVERFINGTLRFLDIASACQKVLEAHNFLSTPNLEELLAADRWARQEVEQWS
jgi:1-deoxy-D-xylulose-5-phosphate reductoisomerase